MIFRLNDIGIGLVIGKAMGTVSFTDPPMPETACSLGELAPPVLMGIPAITSGHRLLWLLSGGHFAPLLVSLGAFPWHFLEETLEAGSFS